MDPPLTPLVLRLPRNPSQGNDANFVLVHISSVGSRPLDIKLIGTENETVFATSRKRPTDRPPPRRAYPWPLILCVNLVTNLPCSFLVKHNKTAALKAKNCPLNQDEWESVLLSILLGTAAEEGKEDVLRGIEAIAEVDGDTLMTLTIQKRIEGITVCFTFLL